MARTGDGTLQLDAPAGKQLLVTRGSAAPEGAGVGYVVPASAPSGPVTVMLPSLPGTVTPAVDTAERWLFDRVNAERAALGRSALALSSTLSRAADAYAHYLQSTGQFSHTALSTPGVRAVDQGWPVPGGSAVGETLALSPNKELTLDGWRNSPGHWNLLMMAGLDSAGVGRAGDRWVMMPAQCSGASASERCGLGTDPAVVPPGSSSGPVPAPTGAPPAPATPPTGAPRRPRMRLDVNRRGHRLRVAVRVTKGTKRVRVSVRSKGRRADLRRDRSGRVYRYAARLPRGRWTVTIRLVGKGGWADRRARRVIRVR